jgi:transposase-like protein
MADERMGLLELLRKAGAEGDTDFLREGVRVLAEVLMDAEVSELTGVPKGERAPEKRLTQRNGYRERRSRYPRRHARAGHSPGARRQLLPLAP